MTKAKAEKIDHAAPDIEFRLRERERFLRTLIGNLPGVVFRCRADADFTKEFVSDGCFELTGYRAAELVGASAVKTWRELLHAEDCERVFAELRQIIDDSQIAADRQHQIVYRIVARDNAVKHVRDRFRVVRDSRGEIAALEGFAIDITATAAADERVRQSEARYKLLAENMRDLVCLHDLNGNLLYVSPSSQTMLGFAPAELVGKSPCELFHPEDAERLRDDAHARLLKGETGIIVEYRIKNRAAEYRWFETMAQTVVSPVDNQIVQLQTVSRDITTRKAAEAETRRAQEELARLLFSEQEARRDADLARVEAEHASRVKDEFLQMVSHEFRTPLTTIKTLVRVLQHGGSSADEQLEYLETIASESDRLIDMILNLLDISRLEENDVDLKREPLDINRVLISCEQIERPAATARNQVFNVALDKSLPKVAGDEKALRRALCTVIENAIKYTPENGMVTVAARHIGHSIARKTQLADKKIAAELFGDLPSQMDFAVEIEAPPETDQIAVIICDTGRGILPEDIPKLFQKFYRGKKPFADTATDGTPDDAAGKAETPGVGLGLYLAKRVVNALDGRIAVNSEPGRGSCFTIFLPVWNHEQHQTDSVDEYDFDERLIGEK